MTTALTQKLKQIFKSQLVRFKHRITAKVWPKESIVFYTGFTPKEWTKENLRSGIGGAETAIIYLGQEWLKAGKQVTIYTNCGNKEGNYDGVNYLHYNQFNPYDSFSTLIVWRYPWRVDYGQLRTKIKAKRLWLDLHEMLLPEEVTRDKISQFDKIFVKSQYHSSLLKEIPAQKIALIPNGVAPKYLQESNGSKEPYKLIYASQYAWGLDLMLLYGWPIIKKEIPQAELHIYYGWGILNNPKPQYTEKKRKLLELMDQPGVREHGRVGQDQLLQAKSTAAIHYYGCIVREIDCISVRESALVGCVPVTTDYAALGEKPYCLKVPGNPYLQETQESLAGKIVELLKNPPRLEEIRLKFQDSAKEETWDKIALAWLDYQ